jgi:hypothetical protein
MHTKRLLVGTAHPTLVFIRANSWFQKREKKMATQAQIDANRQNAKKSTGPKTAKGKRKVARNAIKHGLCSMEAVIHGEEQEEYERHREAFLRELKPECKLKKQTQIPGAGTSVTLSVIRDYGDNPPAARIGNKANQSQFQEAKSRARKDAKSKTRPIG